MTSMYILRTDDQRPRILENFSATGHLIHFVWFYGGVFEVGGSNGATSGWTKSKMVAGRRVAKFRIAISLQRFIRSTSYLILV